MKKNLAVALMALITMLYSCSSDSDGGSSTTTGSFTATIDGQAFTTQNATASAVEGIFEGGGIGLKILVTKSDNSVMTMIIPLDELREGTNVFTGFNAEGSLTYLSPSGSSYKSSDPNGEFNLNITDIDLDAGHISGTFTGKLIRFESDEFITITAGHFDGILLVNQSFYAGGSMSLSRNNGAVFEMDEDPADGKYVLVYQDNTDDRLNFIGYNTNSTGGTYILSLPLDVAPGTYDIGDGTGFYGLFSASGAYQAGQIDGSVTVTSHSNKHIVGTFNYSADEDNTTTVVTNGSFDITHK